MFFSIQHGNPTKNKLLDFNRLYYNLNQRNILLDDNSKEFNLQKKLFICRQTACSSKTILLQCVGGDQN